VRVRMVQAVYERTASLPPGGRYGLRAQLRPGAVSVPANLTEGYGRGTQAEDRHHLNLARGSLCELATHPTITARLKSVRRTAALQAWKLIRRVRQMLTRLRASLPPDTRALKPDTRRSSDHS
jgi:four helix bundle protein